MPPDLLLQMSRFPGHRLIGGDVTYAPGIRQGNEQGIQRSRREPARQAAADQVASRSCRSVKRRVARVPRSCASTVTTVPVAANASADRAGAVRKVKESPSEMGELVLHGRSARCGEVRCRLRTARSCVNCGTENLEAMPQCALRGARRHRTNHSILSGRFIRIGSDSVTALVAVLIDIGVEAEPTGNSELRVDGGEVVAQRVFADAHPARHCGCRRIGRAAAMVWRSFPVSAPCGPMVRALPWAGSGPPHEHPLRGLAGREDLAVAHGFESFQQRGRRLAFLQHAAGPRFSNLAGRVSSVLPIRTSTP